MKRLEIECLRRNSGGAKCEGTPRNGAPSIVRDPTYWASLFSLRDIPARGVWRRVDVLFFDCRVDLRLPVRLLLLFIFPLF